MRILGLQVCSIVKLFIFATIAVCLNPPGLDLMNALDLIRRIEGEILGVRSTAYKANRRLNVKEVAHEV